MKELMNQSRCQTAKFLELSLSSNRLKMIEVYEWIILTFLRVKTGEEAVAMAEELQSSPKLRMIIKAELIDQQEVYRPVDGDELKQCLEDDVGELDGRKGANGKKKGKSDGTRRRRAGESGGYPKDSIGGLIKKLVGECSLI